MSALGHLLKQPAPIVRPGRVVDRGWASDAQVRLGRPGELRERTLSALWTGPMTCIELAKRMKADRHAIRKVLNKLIAEKVVTRSGKWGSYAYALVQP